MTYLFTFAKVEVIWFDILVSDHQSLALLRVLHINQVSDQTFGLRLKLETLVSAKDKVTRCTRIVGVLSVYMIRMIRYEMLF